MKTVILSGASTGIGQATAVCLASKGWQVFAGVRKQSDADKLSTLSPLMRPLILDVTKPHQIADAIETVSIALAGRTLDGLVNNAGIANMGPLALQPMDDFRAHFDVNVFGLLALTQAALPLLGTDASRSGLPGRIVNITSVGGRLSAPFLGAYSPTKHAVEAMTDSLRRELMVYGIDAIAIGPGSVKTPIWDKAETANKDAPYKDTVWGGSIDAFADVMLQGGRDGLPPEEIAEVVE